MKYFTKSAFKEALICPGRLYYYQNPDYANQAQSDAFLEALAEGGFQVGELAKVYNEVPEENDFGRQVCRGKSKDELVEATARLLALENCVIAEASFSWCRCYVRVDILRKKGNLIEIGEVKAKSWDPFVNVFLSAKKVGEYPAESISSDWREYVYDVAFQKYVVENALKEMFPGQRFDVRASLVLVDKSVEADLDRVNQYFKIETGEADSLYVKRMSGWEVLRQGKRLLVECKEVDGLCNNIILGVSPEQRVYLRGMCFVDFVREMSKAYCEGCRIEVKLTVACYACPYYTLSEAKLGEKGRLLDGYDECWRHKTDGVYVNYEDRSLVEDLWAGGAPGLKARLVANGKYFLEDVSVSDLKFNTPKGYVSGLKPDDRRMVQIVLSKKEPDITVLGEYAKNVHDGIYLDVEGLRAEMGKWRFPLHMIDFETSAVALPFYKGMHPYENVAFQFSHHIIEKDGNGYKVRHAKQWVNTEGDFPNFKFVRELKNSLGDSGTIFRYAQHENTILRGIRDLLAKSGEADKDELIAFIDSITQLKESEKAGSFIEKSPRNMVDLLEIVKRFYYHPIMKGSNSIKVVLPAVLASSDFLFNKYSKPIYGSEIHSENIAPENPIAWIAKRGENPYKMLERLSDFMPKTSRDIAERVIDEDPDVVKIGGKTINNGGAALWAYGLLQFCEETPEKKQALVKALLRYCELDTLSMVFIWEYFNDVIHAK